MAALPELFTYARLLRGLTVDEAAVLAEMPVTIIRRIESGETEPDLAILRAIGFDLDDGRLCPRVSDWQMQRAVDEYESGKGAERDLPGRLRIAAQVSPILDRPGVRRVCAAVGEVLSFARGGNYALSGLEACASWASMQPIIYLDRIREMPWSDAAFGQRGVILAPLEDKHDLIEQGCPHPMMRSEWALMDSIASPGRQSDVGLSVLDIYQRQGRWPHASPTEL